MNKVFNKRNQFLSGILVVLFGTMFGFQNCSPDQYYQGNNNPKPETPLSDDLSKLIYEVPSGLRKKLEVGEALAAGITVDLEEGLISFHSSVGTEKGEKQENKTVKLSGIDLEKIEEQISSIKYRKCTSEEVAGEVCGGYEKFVLKSKYKEDPDKKLFFGKECMSTEDLTADYGQKELYNLILGFEPHVAIEIM